MNLLALDFESQSDEASVTNVTEIGATLVEFFESDPAPILLERLSQIIYSPSYPGQTAEIVELTGITDEMLKSQGVEAAVAFPSLLFPLIEKSDWVIAHNLSFDEAVYRGTCHRLGLTPVEPKQGWLCSIQDIPYAAKYKCKKLSHLCFDHGIVSDPDKLHRAVYDTDLLMTLVTTKYDINEIIAYKNIPWEVVFLNGVLGPWEDKGVSNKMAKKLGYSWESPRGTDLKYPKRWVKRVKQNQLQAEKDRTPTQFTLTKCNEPKDLP